jgi:hypothetical protein
MHGAGCRVVALNWRLAEHQDLAIRAFRETAAHRFPGTLEQMKEATDD